jgi:parvulin-like peptidyl-prolyl isomerase
MKKLLLGSLIVVSSLFAGDILAVVNGTPITKAEVDSLLKAQKITYDQLPPQYQKQVLDKVITEALLIQKAENAKVEDTTLYKEELDKLKKQLALKVFLKEKLDSFKVSDEEVKSFYEQNKDIMFKQQPQVKARHILVKTKEEAEKIISELKKTPQYDLENRFIELAKKDSVGPSGKNGGELGWFSKDKMIPAFSKVAFSLKKGSFTLQPVKTRFGWHIIYVEDKKEGGYTPFEEVKEKIKEQLKFKRLKQYIDSVKNSANIEYKQ